MTPDVSVSRDIAASPSTVFAALTDITRMGEWSPETYEAEWNEGFDSPTVGAMFTGHNRNGDKEWSVPARITELVADERFVFDCVAGSTGEVFATWGYAIEPIDGGSRVTEKWHDLRSQVIIDAGASISGVADRKEHNRAGMEATLERLANALE